MFTEHGITESVKSDSAPHFISILFSEFTATLKFVCMLILLHNSHANEMYSIDLVNINKGLLTNTKYSGLDPYLVLLSNHSTPIDSCSPSATELLYQ